MKKGVLLLPVGHLLFVVGVFVLGLAALALGDDDELGFFTRRVAVPLWRSDEATRRGRQIAAVIYLALIAYVALPMAPADQRLDLALVPIGSAVWAFLRHRRAALQAAD